MERWHEGIRKNGPFQDLSTGPGPTHCAGTATISPSAQSVFPVACREWLLLALRRVSGLSACLPVHLSVFMPACLPACPHAPILVSP